MGGWEAWREAGGDGGGGGGLWCNGPGAMGNDPGPRFSGTFAALFLCSCRARTIEPPARVPALEFSGAIQTTSTTSGRKRG